MTILSRINREMMYNNPPTIVYSLIDNNECIFKTKTSIHLRSINKDTFNRKKLSLFFYLINSDELMSTLKSYLSFDEEKRTELVKHFRYLYKNATEYEIIMYLIIKDIISIHDYIIDKEKELSETIELLNKAHSHNNYENTLLKKKTEKYEFYSSINFDKDIFIPYIELVIHLLEEEKEFISEFVNLKDNRRLEHYNFYNDNFSLPRSSINYLIEENGVYSSKKSLYIREYVDTFPQYRKEVEKILKKSKVDSINDLNEKDMKKAISILKKFDDEHIKKYDNKNSFSYKVMEEYDLYDIKEFIDLSNYIIYRDNITILKCKNCGKLFIQKTRITETLCDNIYRNGKTCKELSSVIKLENDEISKVYRNAYKLENGRLHRLGINNEVFKNKFFIWNEKARELMKECQAGKITIEEYKNWIKENKEWYRKEVN